MAKSCNQHQLSIKLKNLQSLSKLLTKINNLRFNKVSNINFLNLLELLSRMIVTKHNLEINLA